MFLHYWFSLSKFPHPLQMNRSALLLSIIHSCPSSSLRQTKPHILQNPNSSSFASLLHEIKELEPLRQIHANIIASGLEHNIFLSNRLLQVYFLCRDSISAEEIFRKMPYKNVVSWTTMVNSYWKSGCPCRSVDAFCEMMVTGVMPNSVTIVSILPACSDLSMFPAARSVHGFMVLHGFKANVYVDTAILDMYVKAGCFADAQQAFDRMSERNVVSWNVMMNCYLDIGDFEGGMNLFTKMKLFRSNVDNFTFSCLLCICTEMRCLIRGTLIHGHVVRYGFEKSFHVGAMLMHMYVSCGSADDAFQVFASLPCKDAVSWSTMISGFTQLGFVNKAVELFNQMMVEGIYLDSVSLVEHFSLCSRLGALWRGICLHGLVMKTGFHSDSSVGTAIIDMYSKSGDVAHARHFFDEMAAKDIICWNAMITGCGINGCGDEAVGLYWRMKSLGFEPNGSTFVSILSACSHTGLVHQGLHLFEDMVKRSKLVPNMQHYACLLDLLCRGGLLHDAYELLNSMPIEPDANILGVLLRACKIYDDVHIGAVIATKIFELEPKDVGCYALLSNWYAGLENWDRVGMMQNLLRLKGMKKEPGCSLIEVRGNVHAFVKEDTCHP